MDNPEGVVDTLSKQVQHLQSVQENMRNYFTTQYDAVRSALSHDYVTYDRLNEKIEGIKSDIVDLRSEVDDVHSKLDNMEQNILSKIESLGKRQEEGTKENYKRIITVQATVLITVLSTVVGLVAQFLLRK